MKERSLIEGDKHMAGRYGGFNFGGQVPDGITVNNPLPKGVTFPNGAKSAILLTFDVEGNYGNGVGDQEREIANFVPLCNHIAKKNITATFNVVGRMVEEHGPEFIRWMLDANCEVAPHGYYHDLNKHYGGDRVYAGHYEKPVNMLQVGGGIAALNNIQKGCVSGSRLPYGHFNEFSYESFVEAGLTWSSNVCMDDFTGMGHGFGSQPFMMQLGEQKYPIIEIPMDGTIYDWPIFIADKIDHKPFIDSISTYCKDRNIPFDRTPAGAIPIWKQRIDEAVSHDEVYSLLLHTINETIIRDNWGDPLDTCLLPLIDLLAEYQDSGKVWICTCNELATFYKSHFKEFIQ